jgi:hypothetical protein
MIFERAESEGSSREEDLRSEEMVLSPIDNYLGSEVHSIAMDLMIIVIVRGIVDQLSGRSTKFDEYMLQ